MNLLGLLMQTMLSQSSVNSVSGKTGLSDKQIKKLMLIAIPLLLKYMTGNASQGSGALSLLSALSQHTSKKSMDVQLNEADTADGSKIIGHILGNDEKKVTGDLAAQTGMDADQIRKVLAVIAPALMSGVSEAATTASAAPAAPQQAAAPSLSLNPGAGIFGSLLGLGKEEAPAAVSPGGEAAGYDGTALLQMLMQAMR